MTKNKPVQHEWIVELVDAAERAVLGYEQYLLEKINYKDLAIIMQELRRLLPMDNDDEGEHDE